MKPIISDCAFKKPKCTLSGSHVDLKKSMYTLTYLVIKSKSNVRSSERNILKSSHKITK